MPNFSIEDNHIDWRSLKGEMGCSETDVDNLKRIANVNLCDLNLDDHPNLLVFPESWNKYHDDVHKSCIFEISNGNIRTGNIMGFVGVNETKLSITSRFTPGRNDYFLHYMLQKVLALNVVDLKHSTDEDYCFCFLIYLFPHFLLKALRQGVYKTYIRKQYNDANLKGVIDIPRHIRQNIPFNGRIAYNTREYCADNNLTQLVRHTIEYIRQHRLAGNILTSTKDIRDAVATICFATPSYNCQQRQRIIVENLRPLRHPYFSEYRPLQKLCIAILRHEELKYGRQKDEVYGVLFDGAWLWEEYLNTILSKAGFEHPRNKEGVGRKYLFQGNKGFFYPDFFRTNTIIDAKYKRMADEPISREDLYQIITYLHVLEADETGIIHPSFDSQCQKVNIGTLNGLGGNVFTIPFPIPQNAKNMKDFTDSILIFEEKLTKVLNKT